MLHESLYDQFEDALHEVRREPSVPSSREPQLMVLADEIRPVMLPSVDIRLYAFVYPERFGILERSKKCTLQRKHHDALRERQG